MCKEIIDSGSDTGKGLPIGNLTSQWWANLYLDQLDHFVKEEPGSSITCDIWMIQRSCRLSKERALAMV